MTATVLTADSYHRSLFTTLSSSSSEDNIELCLTDEGSSCSCSEHSNDEEGEETEEKRPAQIVSVSGDGQIEIRLAGGSSNEGESYDDDDGILSLDNLLNSDQDDEGIEISESFFDAFVSNLIDRCGTMDCSSSSCRRDGSGASARPKSVLRRSRTSDHHHYGRRHDDDDPGEGAQPMNHRAVSFSSLVIREFNMTLGNHPSASSGPPVMLDWNSVPQERVVDVEEYEQDRGPRRRLRQLKLTKRDRRGILQRERGFSEEEVNEAWAEARRIRKQRQETVNRGVFLMLLDDAWESAGRKYQRFAESLAPW